MLRLLWLGLFILHFSSHLYSQTEKIARLKNEILGAENSEQKLKALFAFCEEKQSLHTDTLCKYASAAKEISIQEKNPLHIALAEYYLGSCLVKKSSLDTALRLCEQNILKLRNEPANIEPLMKLKLLKAQILIRSAKYKEGIAEVYKILHTAEESQDTLMQMVAKNAIGWANMEMNQRADALKWFFIALATSDNTSYHEKNSNIYSNIAAVYKQLHKNDSAEYYIRKSIGYSRKIENLFFLANGLNILADIYINTKRAALAEGPLTEALAIRKQIGDPFYIVSDISQLAIYYANISKPSKGIALSMQGVEMAKKLNLSSKLPFLYHALGENYKVAGNYAGYSKTLELIMALKDSIYAATSAQAKAEMYVRYELKKKENLIILQKLALSKKNFLFYGSLVLLFFTLLMSWLLFRGYKKNQQIKLLKMQAEEKQLAARAVMSAEEKERKRISRDLHDNIGAYTTVLMANTEQLKRGVFGNTVQQCADNIHSNARDIMESLQETIWVLNNDVITLTDFIDRFKLYTKKILYNFSEIQIIFKEDLESDLELSPAEALHLFRIMQEAVQNTIKHAGPGKILISVESHETVLISIRDNGTGFNKENVRNGNGLINMQQRAKEAGYHFNIFSTGEGTEITLQKNHAFAV